MFQLVEQKTLWPLRYLETFSLKSPSSYKGMQQNLNLSSSQSLAPGLRVQPWFWLCDKDRRNHRLIVRP